MLRFVLLLSLLGVSLQGGAKPQQNAGGNPIYQPDYSRGAGVQQPGNTGPLGAKSAGKYPQNPSQAYQQGPYGIGNGYGGQGVKAGKSGPGQYPQAAKQKPGYANRAGSFLGNVLGQGQGAKSQKAGYGAAGYPNIAAQGGYGNGAAGYPSNIGQQGYGGKPSKAGYGAGTFPQYAAQPQGYGAANYPQQYGEQTGYGAGSYPQYGAQAGYGTNGGQYPGNFQQPGYGGKPQKAGYRNGYGGYPNAYQQQQLQQQQQQQQQQGIGGKPSKAGYGNGAALYQGGIGKPSKVASGYPSNVFPQQGIGAKPSKAGLYQQPYSNGVKSPLGAYQGPVGENAKLGAYGQLPYRSQPDALGYDPKAAKTAGAKSPYGAQAGYPDAANTKYAGAKSPYGAQAGYADAANAKYAGAKSPYGAQAGYPDAANAKYGAKSPYGAQAGYPDAANTKYAGAGQTSFNGQSVPQNPLEEEISPSAAVEGGYQQLGAGQSAWTYAPEESAYVPNGYYGNSYRGCGGKC